MGVINYCNKVPLPQIYRMKPNGVQPSKGGPGRAPRSPSAACLTLIIGVDVPYIFNTLTSFL